MRPHNPFVGGSAPGGVRSRFVNSVPSSTNAMKLRTTFPTVLLLAALTPTATAIEMYWEPLPGRAKDIAAGADGSVWIVGSGLTNGDVYKWNGSTWVLIGGSGVFIAVGPQGDPWVVNFASNLYHRTNNHWELVTQSGSATGVSVGADGAVLITGGSSCFCGPVSDQRLFRYQAATGFAELPGGGHGAVIEPDGTGWWVLDSAGKIFRWQGGPEYVAVAGHARDISRGAGGDIWIVGGANFETGNDPIYRWNGAQFEAATTGQARQISVGPEGTPWVVDSGGKIFRGHALRLQTSDVTVNEGNDLKFPVTLSYPSDRTASVAFQVRRPDGGVAQTGTLIFTPGQTNQIVTQATLVDPAFTGPVQYRLQLSNGVGADLAQSAAIGTVIDISVEPVHLSPSLTAGGGFKVSLNSRLGYTYQLQRRNTLTLPADWSPVTRIDGTGNPVDLSDATRPPDQAFYRVLVTAKAISHDSDTSQEF